MIIAAADGSALGNPGPAGWAWYVDDDCWASGGWPHGTNNMGELMSLLDLLQQTAHVDEDLTVHCDSTYVIKAVTEWMPGWKRRGWRKRDGKPVMNVELVKALDEQMAARRERGVQVRLEWVKGHSGHELNEAADRRANAAAVAFKEGRDPDPGPGFPDGARSHPDARVGQVEDEPDLLSELAGSTAELTDAERVVALERSLLSDEVRADPAEVAALLHPAWSEVGASGRLWSREDMLSAIAPVDPVDLEVVSEHEVAPGVRLLVWRAVGEERSVLRSSLWVEERGGWRQVFHQGTVES